MTELIDTRVSRGPGSGFQSSPAWQPLVIATLLPFHVGTGGAPAIDTVAAGRTNLTIVREESVEEGAQTDPVATSDRVLLIRRWLSLSVAEAARVLGVQRPTIYAWERGDVPHRTSHGSARCSTWRVTGGRCPTSPSAPSGRKS